MNASCRRALPRLAAVSVGVVIALPSLAAPALAAGPEGRGAQAQAAAADQKAAEKKAADQKAAEKKAADQKAAEKKDADQKAAEKKAADKDKKSNKAESSAKPAKSGKPSKSAKSDKPAKSGKPAKPAKSDRSAKPAKSGKPSKSAKPAGDPAGNNGTIKINTFGTTDGNANHPHPGCGFRLQMFNFDANQTGTITFAGQAPTAGAVTSQPLAGTQLLSDDAAGGGQDVDSFYDVTAASLGLTGAPHPQQGYHVKVLVDADDAPGGAKQKVFWLNCPGDVTPAPSAPGEGSGAGESSPFPFIPALPTAGELAPELLPFTPEFTGGASTGTLFDTFAPTRVSRTAVVGPQAAATQRTAGQAAGQAALASQQIFEDRPVGALPFTGVELRFLLTIALVTLLAGAALVYGGKRRTA